MKIYYGAGLNENQYPHPAEAAKGSYNFDLRKDSSFHFPRKPFDVLGTADNGADVRGLIQLIKRDDSSTSLVQAGAVVYTWTGGSSFTSNTTLVTNVCQLRDVYWSLGDYLVITDLQKKQVVSKWDGTTFSALTTGLGTNLYAKYGVVHQGRVWLFNVQTTTDTPHLLVASAFENPTSYDTSKRAVSGTFVTGSEAFYMLTPDLKPINGVALFHGDLVISTERGRLYRLTGSSASDYKWVDFYANSFAVGTESLVDAGNDLYYMRSGGNIESLLATERYGDVSADDLSRWIPDTVRNLTGCIAVYDPPRQRVLFFVAGKVLALYKDILTGGAVVDDKGTKAPGLSPWSIYKTAHVSNFTASAARYMRLPGTDTYTVVFGGPNGEVCDMQGTDGGGDGGEDVTCVRITRFMGPADGVDYRRRIPRGRVQYERTKECQISLGISWSDEYNESTANITLNGPLAADTAIFFGGGNYFGGSVYFGTDNSSAGVKSHKQFSHVGRGEIATLTLSSTNKVIYHIDNVELL